MYRDNQPERTSRMPIQLRSVVSLSNPLLHEASSTAERNNVQAGLAFFSRFLFHAT